MCSRKSWIFLPLATIFLVVFARTPGEALAQELIAQQPIVPRAQDKDLRSLADDNAVREWKPGDPVRVMEDLREDKGADQQAGESRDEALPDDQRPVGPFVRGPVAPQVLKEDLSDLSKVKPYRPGEPVRVMPDLRESESNEAQ